MSISDVHPHDARRSELWYLASVVFVGATLFFLILMANSGQPANPAALDSSFLQMLLWRLDNVGRFSIPCLITVVVGVAMIITNSSFFENMFSANGYTPGETAFALLGLWIGAAWGLSVNPEGLTLTTRQLTTFGACVGVISFSLIAVLTRGLR